MTRYTDPRRPWQATRVTWIPRMDTTPITPNTSTEIWLAASLVERRIVYHRPAQPGPHEPGTLNEQLAIAELAAKNPWHFVDPADAMRAARRTIMHHARRSE